MAECQDCGKEMSVVDTCTLSHITLNMADNKEHERSKYFVANKHTGRCHDCGIKEGGFHHLGCDVERCPGCGWQLISCECWCDCNCHKGLPYLNDGVCSYCEHGEEDSISLGINEGNNTR